MQGKDRTLRRFEIAAALDPFHNAGDLVHRPLDRHLPGRFDHLEQAATDHVDRSGQQILQLLGREIIALADLERQHAVLAGTLDQRRITVRREGRAGIAGRAPDDVAVAAANHDVGEVGRERRPFRHRQQVTLTFGLGNFDQHLVVDHG